jgi:hypothetical protein
VNPVNEPVDHGQSHRSELLHTLTHDLDMALQATVNRDEQALESSVRKIASSVEALRLMISSDNSILSDHEVQTATGVRNSAKKLGKLIERIGKVQRARLRTVRLQGIGGYSG